MAPNRTPTVREGILQPSHNNLNTDPNQSFHECYTSTSTLKTPGKTDPHAMISHGPSQSLCLQHQGQYTKSANTNKINNSRVRFVNAPERNSPAGSPPLPTAAESKSAHSPARPPKSPSPWSIFRPPPHAAQTGPPGRWRGFRAILLTPISQKVRKCGEVGARRREVIDK